MSVRFEWEFPYKADVLTKAAKVKVAHHSGRLAWWKAKKDEIVATVKAEGIEVQESVAGANYASNAQRGAQIVVRADLNSDLQETVRKITEHHGKVEEYLGWVQVLGAQGKKEFKLNHEDWMFFFGKK